MGFHHFLRPHLDTRVGKFSLYLIISRIFQPAVYVAESAISSGTAGSSADGAENTVAIAAGLALVFVAAASLILLQVGKNPPQVQTLEYAGPSLSYYINKFTPQEIIQASVPSEAESSSLAGSESSNAPSTIQVESQLQLEPSTSGPSSAS